MSKLAHAEVANEPQRFPKFYVYPYEQIVKAKKLITENPTWGLQLSDIPDFVPSNEGLGDTEFWVLTFCLPGKGCNSGTWMTINACLKIINKQTPIYILKTPNVKPDNVKLYGDRNYESGIFWRILDFAGGHQDGSSYLGTKDVRKTYPIERLATFEVFSALMLMPEWYKSMDGFSVPYITIPGFKVCPDSLSVSSFHWNFVIYVAPRMAMSTAKAIDNRIDIGKTKNHDSRPGWACCLTR